MKPAKDASELCKATEGEICAMTHIDRALDTVRLHFGKLIEGIKKIESLNLRYFCLFALLEALVQDHLDYKPGQEQRKFTYFICKFQSKWDFISKTEPITLYYDLIDELDESFDLQPMGEGRIFSPAEMVRSGLDKMIRSHLDSKGVSDKIIDCHMKRHSYANLIYRKRYKLACEMAMPCVGVRSEISRSEPYYYSSKRMGRDGAEEIIWELAIPTEFVEKLLLECVEGYLSHCKKTNHVPFANEKFEDKFRLAWYD